MPEPPDAGTVVTSSGQHRSPARHRARSVLRLIRRGPRHGGKSVPLRRNPHPPGRDLSRPRHLAGSPANVGLYAGRVCTRVQRWGSPAAAHDADKTRTGCPADPASGDCRGSGNHESAAASEAVPKRAPEPVLPAVSTVRSSAVVHSWAGHHHREENRPGRQCGRGGCGKSELGQPDSAADGKFGRGIPPEFHRVSEGTGRCFGISHSSGTLCVFCCCVVLCVSVSVCWKYFSDIRISVAVPWNLWVLWAPARSSACGQYSRNLWKMLCWRATINK